MLSSIYELCSFLYTGEHNENLNEIVEPEQNNVVDKAAPNYPETVDQDNGKPIVNTKEENTSVESGNC